MVAKKTALIVTILDAIALQLQCVHRCQAWQPSVCSAVCYDRPGHARMLVHTRPNHLWLSS